MIINIDQQGRISFIASSEAAPLLAAGVASKRRASHVEPVSLLLRIAFHAVRGCVSDESRLAEWTRSWACLWRVRIIGGPTLAGGWRDRKAAIAAEVKWIERHQFGA